MNYPQRRAPYKMRLFGKASTYHGGGGNSSQSFISGNEFALAKHSFQSKAKSFLLLNEKGNLLNLNDS